MLVGTPLNRRSYLNRMKDSKIRLLGSSRKASLYFKHNSSTKKHLKKDK